MHNHERLAVQQAREKLARLFQDTPDVQIQGEQSLLGQRQKQQFAKQTEKWLISPFSGGSGHFDCYGREIMSSGPQLKPLTAEQGVRFKAEAEAELERLKIEPTVIVPVLRDAARIKESGNPRLWLAEEGLYSQLWDFANETTPDPDAAMDYLTVRIRRCKSKSRGAFIAWGIQQIAKQAGTHFHLKADAIKKFDIGISDLISHALVTGSKYTDFPQHEHDEKAGVYRVNMGTVESPIVWTIPESLWGYALKLWPVHLRKRDEGKRSKGGYYLVKFTGGQEVPAHRLALQPDPMDIVESGTNNFLDWTSLSIRRYNLSGKYENKKFGTAQDRFERESILVLPEFRTETGQELSAIENISGDCIPKSKIRPNADLGNSRKSRGDQRDVSENLSNAEGYSSAYERNDALESNEESRTLVSTTRSLGEEE